MPIQILMNKIKDNPGNDFSNLQTEENFFYDCFQVNQNPYDDFPDFYYQDIDFSYNDELDRNLQFKIYQEGIENSSTVQDKQSFVSPNEFNNDNDSMHQSKKRNKKESEKVQLTPNGLNFRKKIYRFLTYGMKKVARKELIIKYHGMICQRYSFIRNVQREEYRSIKIYFNQHSDQAFFILKALQELRNEGILNYEKDLRALTSAH